MATWQIAPWSAKELTCPGEELEISGAAVALPARYFWYNIQKGFLGND
jgi:hypothetical protein